MVDIIEPALLATTETSGVSVPISPRPIKDRYLNKVACGTLHPHPFISAKLVKENSFDSP